MYLLIQLLPIAIKVPPIMLTILILGLLFFAVMTIYNLVKAVKDKTSFLSAIFGFLMFLSTLLIILDQVLIGGFALVIVFLLALLNFRTISDVRMRNFLKAMEGIEDISSPALRDIFGLRFWGVYALKKGPRKAAIGYSLFQTGFLILFFVVLMAITDYSMSLNFVIPALIVIFVMGWREFEVIFRIYSEQQDMENSTGHENS